MNKLKYITLLWIISLFTSCIKDEEEIFDESSSTRMDIALEEYRKILMDAEDGWLFEYYPHENKYGGFYLYMHFSEKEVTVTAESSVLEKEGETRNSIYTLKSDMGPVLSFNSYNRIIHQFSDPEPDGLGYEGDYEFIIMNADKDCVELKGKKNHHKMKLTRIPDGKSWKEFISEVDTVIKYHPGFTMELRVKDAQISVSESNKLGRYLTFSTESGIDMNVEGMAFCYTSTGVKFKDPATINGQTVQHFKVSAEGDLVCTDENTDARIRHISLSQAFIKEKANWFFDSNRMGPRFMNLWNSIVQRLNDEMNEELMYIYLRSTSQLLSMVSYGYLKDEAYSASFYMSFVPDEADNEMKVIYEGGGDDSARYIYEPYFRIFLSYITDDAPYRLTYNNLKIPQEMTFRRTDDPEVRWFVLTK